MAITVKHTKVSAIPDGDDDSLILPSDWNSDHALEGLGTMAEQDANAVAITGGTITGTTIPASDVTGLGTMATQDANSVAITGGTISGTSVAGYIPDTEKGAALGVATLDAGGKVPITELPDAVLGALSYQGTWDANTNTPTLTSSVGTKGYYYVVSVAGNTDLNGVTDWIIGDWAVFNGTAWQKVDNTDQVSSVNGQTGVVVLTTTNVAEGTNEYFTTARARSSVSAGTGISYDSGTGVITNSSPSLGGDVVGPASSTDNAIVRFDSTTGKLIQNSTVTIDDDGNASGVNAVSFNTTPATTPTDVGSIYWNTSDGTLDLIMRGGTVVQQIGEEQYYTVRNQTGSTIANGTPVMANGVTAGSARITVTPAIADGSIDELRFIGLTTESISNGINGYVTSFGYVRGLDTRGTPYGETWAEGDFIYVSPTTAGYLTNVEPTAPNLKIEVATVITRHQTLGVLFGRPTAYPHITHLSDVQITTPASGNLLIYDATQSRWENANLTDGTGISITEGAGSITVVNTAPDQTVAITAGTGISVSGTYPNFTVTNTEPSSGGTVTSVSGTAPIASSGGNTPAISISQSSGLTDGYLSSTDWSTFNNKGSGTVTSVGGTGTVNGISLSGTVTSSGNLTLGGTLDLSSPPAIGNTTPNTVAGTVIQATNGIVVNSNTVSASYTIPSGSSAMSAGPMTVASGEVVTISSGSRWVIL
jgi:hypothetical protein